MSALAKLNEKKIADMTADELAKLIRDAMTDGVREGIKAAVLAGRPMSGGGSMPPLEYKMWGAGACYFGDGDGR